MTRHVILWTLGAALVGLVALRVVPYVLASGEFRIGVWASIRRKYLG